MTTKKYTTDIIKNINNMTLINSALLHGIKHQIGNKIFTIKADHGRNVKISIDDEPLFAYKKCCSKCLNEVKKSQHCNNNMNWFFCNNCFQNDSSKRHSLYKTNGVIRPFKFKKCKKADCDNCHRYDDWLKNNNQSNVNADDDENSLDDFVAADDELLSGAESSDDESSDDEEKTIDESDDEIEIIRKNYNRDDDDDDDEDVDDKPQKKKRRLTKRSIKYD